MSHDFANGLLGRMWASAYEAGKAAQNRVQQPLASLMDSLPAKYMTVPNLTRNTPFPMP
ncbi:hypothetical protein Aph01nite_59430 [Acrocarpospora phusangensis]|uniref:Uncharacterized protein n=1 Tax=Acrocarpospora phusangensis TaxID=1070424 RepID=A0A919URM1_9ACTN|nr:hypothetical protein Aph01nite_59430 [Acrocarpospora phusangensis]